MVKNLKFAALVKRCNELAKEHLYSYTAPQDLAIHLFNNPSDLRGLVSTFDFNANYKNDEYSDDKGTRFIINLLILGVDLYDNVEFETLPGFAEADKLLDEKYRPIQERYNAASEAFSAVAVTVQPGDPEFVEFDAAHKAFNAAIWECEKDTVENLRAALLRLIED